MALGMLVVPFRDAQDNPPFLQPHDPGRSGPPSRRDGAFLIPREKRHDPVHSDAPLLVRLDPMLTVSAKMWRQ